MKRLLEGFAAAAILVLGMPLWLLLALLVRLTSPGPAIFAQPRVGKGKKVFTCYKFRTMAQNTKQAGTHEVCASAVTGFGQFLRKTKLDEAPQILNILKGEMSFVGPRPCLPVQEELIREREKRGVFHVLPGVTGLGQVRGIDMSDPVRLAECDAEYVKQASFGADFRLLWLTLMGAGQGDRVKSAGSTSGGSGGSLVA